MAEDESHGAETTHAQPSSDAVAWAAALGSAGRDNANAFLDEQRELAHEQKALARLQTKELAHELSLRHWSLRVRHVSDVIKLSFEIAIAFIVLAIAIGIGAAIWQAAHAEGLVISSFDVPASFSARGLTGKVVANKLLDRLTVMQSETDSTRAASSFANDWTNDIKVEIPDTGISLGDAVRFLHGWLGHEMHLSGELYETPGGIALTVRMDNDSAVTFEGKPGQLENIVARAAEAVFAGAQPYRYQVYLANRKRYAESAAAGRALAAAGPRNEAAWAMLGLGIGASYAGRIDAARRYFDASRNADPELPNPVMSQATMERILGHEESALGDARRAVALLGGTGGRDWNPTALAPALTSYEGYEAGLVGDFVKARTGNVASAGSSSESSLGYRSVYLSLGVHDLAAARRFVEELDDMRTAPGEPPYAAMARGLFLVAEQDWQRAISQFDFATASLQEIEKEANGRRNAAYLLRPNVWPNEARAYAMLDRFDKAEAILNTLPADCDICARAHGQVEAERKNWSAAANWFRVVSERSPDIPFADSEWGAMLLAKGDIDAAIAKFRAANLKGPHFADPLEMWGEALMQQNRSDLALAKFEEASKYAHNWGRLHLKWGEALFYAGHKDDARKQFTIAASLDLSTADKTALAKWMTAHG